MLGNYIENLGVRNIKNVHTVNQRGTISALVFSTKMKLIRSFNLLANTNCS